MQQVDVMHHQAIPAGTAQRALTNHEGILFEGKEQPALVHGNVAQDTTRMSLQTIGTEILATPSTDVGLPTSLKVGNTNPYFQLPQEQTSTDELDKVVEMYYQRPSAERTAF